MKFSAQLFVKFWFLQALAFAVNIISWSIIAFQISPGPEKIPLHYNIFYGTDTVGSGYYLYLIPAIGLFIWLANLFFSMIIRKRDNFASIMLVSSSLLAGILVLISVIFLKSFIVL